MAFWSYGGKTLRGGGGGGGLPNPDRVRSYYGQKNWSEKQVECLFFMQLNYQTDYINLFNLNMFEFIMKV